MNPGPRRKCSVLEFHIGLMDQLFTFENGLWVAHPERFFAITDIAKHMGDFIGALHAGTSEAALPLEMQDEIRHNDNSRKLFAQHKDRVTVFPFRTPTGPFPGPNGSLMYMSAAEFQGAPLMRLLTVSATPGDLSVPAGSPLQSGGKQPTVAFRVGQEVQPNTMMYANLIATEDFITGQSGSGFSIAWPQT